MTGPIHTTGTWPTPASGPYPLPGSHIQQTPPPAERRGKTWLWATVIIAGIAFTGLCAGLGAALASRHPSTPAAAPVTTAERHQQDINLCTAYAVATAAVPRPITIGNDLLPARLTLLRTLDENRDASPDLREALTNVAAAWYARAALPVKSRGLTELAPYDAVAAQAAIERAWHLCGLDE